MPGVTNSGSVSLRVMAMGGWHKVFPLEGIRKTLDIMNHIGYTPQHLPSGRVQDRVRARLAHILSFAPLTPFDPLILSLSKD